MDYRLYQPDDFAALYRIEESCFKPPLRFPRAYMREKVDSKRTATWVAEEREELAGFAIVEWLADAPEIAYIETIEVAAEFRKRGIGAGLLQLAEDAARAAGARSIWLHVDTENEAAVRLYEAHGYARQDREENYYARSRAAFVYAKLLVD